MQKIAIIIPCYNEQNRLEEANIKALLSKRQVDIYLANDGSTDETLKKITAISSANNLRCFVIDYKFNEGKAATVFKSVNYISNNGNYDFIGYLDADFSTPVSEIVRMITCLEEDRQTFLFGSRIKLLNSNIDRKALRHIVGRIIITILNFKFKLGIYDTQCGAKFFNREAIKIAFSKKFNTSWLFDVEVFVRLKKVSMLSKGTEFPLKEWKDVSGSKLGIKDAFKIMKEILLLIKHYD